MENLTKKLGGICRKPGIKLLAAFLILNMAACKEPAPDDVQLTFNQFADSGGVTQIVEQANTDFRATMQSILNQVSRENGLPELDDNFVMVNPTGSHVAPVALTKEACAASGTDLEKGKDILLAYFNLPDDSEITSGFYLLNVKKSSGDWTAELRNMSGKTVLTKKPVVEIKDFLNVVPGRTASMFEGKYAVRFGAQLKEISFYLDVEIGSSKNVITPQDKYAQAVMKEILRFRGQIEGIMNNTLTIKSEIFIATRKDALLIAALSDSNGKSVPVMIVRSNTVSADFYTVYRAKSQLKGQISGQKISTTFTDFSTYSSLSIGFTGGITGNRIYTGYVGNIIKGEYHIPIL